MDYPTEKRGMNQGQMENQNYSPQQPGYPNQQIPYQQQQYGQPVQYAVQPAIVVNQVSPVIVRMPKLGLSPVSTTCPFCRTTVTTTVEQSFNCCACLLCCYTGFLVYACIQLCNDKSILCCDATHRCPLCGGIIGQYLAS